MNFSNILMVIKNTEEERNALTAIRKMLHEVKTVAPRNEKQGWKIPKFHEIQVLQHCLNRRLNGLSGFHGLRAL